MTEQIIPDYLSYATENHASDIFIIAGRPLSVNPLPSAASNLFPPCPALQQRISAPIVPYPSAGGKLPFSSFQQRIPCTGK